MKKQYIKIVVLLTLVLGVCYILFIHTFISQESSDSELKPNNTSTMALSLTSPAFEHNAFIPSLYTCDGENTAPPLAISSVPKGTGSLVLVMDDPDIPDVVKESRGIEKFDHWVLYNIPPDATEIVDGAVLGSQGINGRGDEGYTGPCPPPEYEPQEHRYIFRLYAIKGSLNFIKAPTLEEVELAAKSSAIESTELIGRYSRAQVEN